VLALVVKPGAGMNVDVHTLDAQALTTYAEHAKSLKDVAAFLLKIIPSTAFDAFARGDILQVLVFAVLFGSALSLLGEKAKRVSSLIDELAQVFFRIMGFIIKLAPLGVLGAIAFTTGTYGVASLEQLGLLVLVFYASCALFVVLVLGSVMRLAGFNVFKLIRYLREELAIVLGTASSDAVLPQVMRKLEWMGVKDSTVGLVIPTGYSFNLDGFSIYLTLAVLFIAQATNTPLSTHDLIVVVLVSLVTSKGAHGIPGSAIVILAATLSAIPAIPVLGLVLILPVDWFVGIARAITNLIGNCVATVVVAAWERDIDRARAHRVLDQDPDLRFVQEAELPQLDTPAPGAAAI
jgi:aerobic C4-dicarboxylate transport protein